MSIQHLEELQRTLIERENMYKQFFDFLPDPVLVVDNRGMILKANTAAERIFQYSADEFEAMHVSVLIPERFQAAHREHWRRYFSLPIAERPEGHLGPVFGLRKDGTEVEIRIKLGSIPINGGSVVALIRTVTS